MFDFFLFLAATFGVFGAYAFGGKRRRQIRRQIGEFDRRIIEAEEQLDEFDRRIIEAEEQAYVRGFRDGKASK